MSKNVNIVGVTGHRSLKHPTEVIKKALREKLHLIKADAVVTGMAIGFDMLAAEVCLEEGIPFVAAIPSAGQTKTWPQEQKQKYADLVQKAYKCKIVCPGDFQIWKLFERNKWIVNRSNILISYWDGVPNGGTYHCQEFAKTQGKPVENIFEICLTLSK